MADPGGRNDGVSSDLTIAAEYYDEGKFITLSPEKQNEMIADFKAQGDRVRQHTRKIADDNPDLFAAGGPNTLEDIFTTASMDKELPATKRSEDSGDDFQDDSEFDGLSEAEDDAQATLDDIDPGMLLKSKKEALREARQVVYKRYAIKALPVLWTAYNGEDVFKQLDEAECLLIRKAYEQLFGGEGPPDHVICAAADEKKKLKLGTCRQTPTFKTWTSSYLGGSKKEVLFFPRSLKELRDQRRRDQEQGQDQTHDTPAKPVMPELPKGMDVAKWTQFHDTVVNGFRKHGSHSHTKESE